MKIGVISDTHGLLRPEVLAALGTCDAILHAGDVGNQSVLDRLRTIAPVYAVRGNIDEEWAESLPRSLTVSLGGVNICMIHDRKNLTEELGDANVVIFGHSHKYFVQRIDGRLWLNPGSCGRRRFKLPVSMAILSVHRDGSTVQRIALE